MKFLRLLAVVVFFLGLALYVVVAQDETPVPGEISGDNIDLILIMAAPVVGVLTLLVERLLFYILPGTIVPRASITFTLRGIVALIYIASIMLGWDGNFLSILDTLGQLSEPIKLLLSFLIPVGATITAVTLPKFVQDSAAYHGNRLFGASQGNNFMSFGAIE